MGSGNPSSAQIRSLPRGWSIQIEEVSAGVYEVRATSEDGRVVSRSGTNPNALSARCTADVVSIQSQKRSQNREK